MEALDFFIGTSNFTLASENICIISFGLEKEPQKSLQKSC